MRCLNCGKPLKNSSSDTDPSVFYCCDPRCNSKHILKDRNGNKLSEREALDRMGPRRTSQSQEINLMDHFPELNEAALKKHVALAVSRCPSKNDISHIHLYEGTPFRYQLVVFARNTKDFDGVKDYWDRSTSLIFESHFKEEVFRKVESQDFWSHWNIIVVKALEEIPDDLVLKKYKWVLYSNDITTAATRSDEGPSS
jgi:hypothetical protein